MDHDYVILLLFLLVVPSVAQRELQTSDAPFTETTNQGINAETSWATEAETTVTSSTVETDPNSATNVSWSPDFGPDVTFNFTVDGSTDCCEVTLQGETFQDKINTTSPCENVTVTGLRNGTAYNLTVVVHRGNKGSTGKSFVFATKVAAPSQPTNFTAAETTDTSVTLTWSPPVPYPGATNYTLIVTDLGSRYYQTSEIDEIWTNTSHIQGYDTWNFTVTDLHPAWNYSFSLSAETKANFSNNATTAAHTNDSAPGKVKNLTVTPGQVAYRQVVASWECPDVTDRNTRITGFAVKTTLTLTGPTDVLQNKDKGCDPKKSEIMYVTPDNAVLGQYSGDTCFLKLTTTGCKDRSVTINVTINVTAETQYVVEVQTLGEAYNSTAWASVNISVPAGPSQKVENLKVVSVNGSAVIVQWDEPQETNGVLCGYSLLVFRNGAGCVQRIWYKVSPDKENIGCASNKSEIQQNGFGEKCTIETVIIGNISSLNQEITLTDLLPDTRYNVTVFAVNGAKEDNGAGHRVSTNGKTNISAPSEPTNFSAMSVTNTSFSLVWSPPVPRPGPTSYTLVIADLGSRYYPSSTDSPQSIEIKGYENSSYSVGLRPAWNYTFSLSAHTERGSSKNITLTISTNDSVPGTVENLTLTPVTESYKQLNVTWRCPNVTARNTLITGFIIQQNVSVRDPINASNDENVTQYITVTSCEEMLNATIPIQPENQYLIWINTLGQQYNSSYWVKEMYCAPAGPSQKVENLTTVSLNESAVVVQWDEPHETNGVLCGYNLLVFTNSSECVQRIWFKVSPAIENNGCTNTTCEDREREEKGTETCINDTEITKDIHSSVAIGGLQPYTAYNITVFAINRAKQKNGTGGLDTCSVTTNMSASDPVTNLNIAALNESALNVTWNRPEKIHGELLGYSITVLNDTNSCVQAILLTAEDKDNQTCHKTKPESQQKGFGENCTQGIVMCGDEASQKQEIAVTGLVPDTRYSVTVFAVNGATQGNGAGHPVSANGTTNISAPSNLTNFSAMSVTNTSVSLFWSPPVPRPGPTSYTLVITDLGSRYYPSSTDSPQSIEIKDYENTSYSPKGLHPAWNYTFTLFAHTMRGSSENVTLTISTNDSAPGVVENFTLTPGVVPYKEVVACWRCPSVTARNTRITGFAVRHKLMGQNSVRDVVFAEQYDMSVMSCETVQNITVPLTAESTFKIEVQTLGEHFNGSTWVSAIYNTSAGAPPNMTGTLMLHPVSEGESQTSFPVSFCTSCLFDESNGKIDYFAVIICATESCNQMESFDLATGQGVRNLSSWHEAKNENFQPLYRSTNDTWQKFVRSVTASQSTQATRQKRSPDPYVYVVGEDNDCSTKPVTTYCNGPLPAGRSFRVAVVSCTTQACSRSELSEAFQTLDADDPFPDAAKAGVAAGIFLACVVVVTFLVCKRRFQAKKTEADESTEMTDLTGRPIPMKDFPHKMKNWMSSNLTPGNLPIPLVEEFKEIKELSPKHPQETAKIEGNGFKNRYRNIMPFDHSRVQLKQIPGDECSDYINANFIPGYHSKHEYIATQGPLEQTTADFWRMVWEQNVPVIVMLSRFIDEAVKKVFPYFPEDDHVDEPQKFGTITVTLKRVRILNDFDVRTFTLAVGKVQRSVQHFFISNWVDHGANLDVGFLLEFVKRVRTDVPPGSRNPMVVHCSAGVGRTGTFIALDYLTQYIDNNPPSASIDIFSYVLSMRNCRTSMVQTADQYVLLYLAVDRVLQGRTNRVSFEEPVYANLGYEDDDSPGSDVGRKRAPDAKAKTDVLPKASGQQRAITPGRKKILTRVSSTESSMSCSSGQETSKLPAASKKKKISRPSEQTSKAVLLPETPGRGHPKPMSVADTSKLSEVLTLSSPLEEALASGPAHGGKRTAPKLSTPEGDLQL